MDKFSFRSQAENKKPPAAFAGGGLDTARLLNPVRQASFPACAMELLIRRAEIDRAMHIA
jgi:hypothetical protein